MLESLIFQQCHQFSPNYKKQIIQSYYYKRKQCWQNQDLNPHFPHHSLHSPKMLLYNEKGINVARTWKELLGSYHTSRFLFVLQSHTKVSSVLPRCSLGIGGELWIWPKQRKLKDGGRMNKVLKPSRMVLWTPAVLCRRVQSQPLPLPQPARAGWWSRNHLSLHSGSPVVHMAHQGPQCFQWRRKHLWKNVLTSGYVDKSINKVCQIC